MEKSRERENGMCRKLIGTLEDGRAIVMGLSTEERETADGRPHEPRDSKKGCTIVYRRSEGKPDTRLEIYNDGGIRTADAFIAFLKENRIPCHEGKGISDGARLIRFRVMGYTRFEKPAFASVGFSPDGKMEYMADENGIEIYPDTLVSAAFHRDYTRLTFRADGMMAANVRCPSWKYQIYEGFRTGPDSLIACLRRKRVGFIYDEDGDTARVSVRTKDGWASILYDRLSVYGNAIAGIQFYDNAWNLQEKKHVYGFAESLAVEGRNGITLPFLAEPVDRVMEDWRTRPLVVEVVAEGEKRK